jgi:hypothetical protein
MRKAGLLNLIPCYQQVDVLGNGIFLYFYDVFFLCSRGVIRTVVVMFLFIVFYSNTAIKLTFLSRSSSRPKSNFKSTKVFVI